MSECCSNQNQQDDHSSDCIHKNHHQRVPASLIQGKNLGNVFALAMSILWTFCSLFVWLLPNLSLQIASWWMHGMDLSALGDWQLTIGNFVLGGITAIISAWVMGWVLGYSWQVVSKNNKN